ncbi:MAG: hypothetical protein U1E53_07295 [Dongiaceae bacterium]
MRMLIPALLAVCALPAGAMAQQASPACAPYRTVVKNLAGSYHEHPVARAIGGEGQALMVVFASEHGATWTAVSVRPKDQLTCIVAAGTDWQIDQMSIGEGS